MNKVSCGAYCGDPLSTVPFEHMAKMRCVIQKKRSNPIHLDTKAMYQTLKIQQQVDDDPFPWPIACEALCNIKRGHLGVADRISDPIFTVSSCVTNMRGSVLIKMIQDDHPTTPSET